MAWAAATLETVLVVYHEKLDPKYLWRLKNAIKLLRGGKHGKRG
jgi:hypothetical protein